MAKTHTYVVPAEFRREFELANQVLQYELLELGRAQERVRRMTADLNGKNLRRMLAILEGMNAPTPPEGSDVLGGQDGKDYVIKVTLPPHEDTPEAPPEAPAPKAEDMGENNAANDSGGTLAEEPAEATA